MKTSIVLAAAGLLSLLPMFASAQEGKAPWEEYDKLISTRRTISALGPDLFGDSVDLQSGALSFSATDVSIPGNSKLPVAFSRKFAVSNRKGYYVHDLPLGDWDLDVPRLSGVFASTWHSERCSIARPPSVFAGDKYFQADDYWQGNKADMPGGGLMLRVISGATTPSTGGPYLWMTSGQTYFSCLETIKNGSGQGFLAITADGTRYWFDWLAQYAEPTLDDKTAVGAPIKLVRRKNVLYATRVEDRFGNWVAYTFSGSKLTTITSNDGRQITVGYNGNGQVGTVSDGSHTWTYEYSYPTSTTGTLTAVIQPDTSRWTIGFAALADAKFHYNKSLDPDDPWRSCFNPGDIFDGPDVTGTITHPSGAVGTFTVSIVRHGRSNVPALCGNYSTPSNDPTDDVAYYPINWDSYSLTTKSVSGPGLTPASWTYAYGSDYSWFDPPSGNGLPVCGSSSGCEAPVCTSDACAKTDVTVVTGPDNHYTRYTFGNSYRYNEGKLLKVEEGSGATSILRTTTKTYNLAQSGQPFPTPVGDDPQSRGDGFSSEYLRPQVSNVITQQGVNFSSTVTSFDSRARPLSTTKSSSLGYSKTEATTYSDNLSLWVLGQVSKLTVDGVVANETGYDTLARPVWHKSFGKLQDTLTYNTDGTLATFKDGNNNITTLSSWYRGVPRSIKHPITPESPTGATETADVDGNGWINWVIDENGAKTCYGYDAMGRVESVTYPSETVANVCDTSKWAQTTASFVPVAATEYGLPAGHWRQIVTTGNGVQQSYYDALWRPIVTREYDSANVSGTQRFTRRAFDASGREVFVSYPGTTDALATGVRTVYDALDRPTSVLQDSELGVLTMTTEYLSGFQRRTTNPRQHATTETFQAFDTPTDGSPVQISQPEGVVTGITRDVFGKPLQLLRSGPVN